MKPPLLFLCHRIPYPPNKGDKIRSWYLLRHLATRYRVFLGAFIDDAADWEHTDILNELCEECCFRELHPARSRLKSLQSLLSGASLSESYYREKALQSWVDRIIQNQNIDHTVVYSSPMAAYVLPHRDRLQRMVMDFVDIDSDKWAQYARSRPWPLNWLYHRESRMLRRFESRIAEEFDVSFFVSPAEADQFRQLAPAVSGKVGYYLNGVDREYFDPDLEFPDPYPAGSRALTFTGAMDYWPNIDAVSWFAREVFPIIRREHPGTGFYIVGSNPTRKVAELGSQPGVVVTGRVKDIRPYIKHALAAVAPMRIGRGIQNKVLEAMAMAKPVLVSRCGIEGIHAINEEEVLIATTPEEYVHSFSRLMKGDYPDLGSNALARITMDFDWRHSLPVVDASLESDRVSHAGI